jgi:hypothetical protein
MQTLVMQWRRFLKWRHVVTPEVRGQYGVRKETLQST